MGRRRKDFIEPVSGEVTQKKEKDMADADFPLQKHFLHEIKRNATEGANDIIEAMTQLFGVSIDSAYRRLRGVSALSLDEAVTLCRYYKIPLSSVLDSKDEGVAFDYQVIDSMKSFKAYLENLLLVLGKVSKADGELIYAADDVPLFYHFKHKEHAAFKIFAWLRSVLQLAEFEDATFDTGLIPEDLLELAAELHNSYTKVNSTEIWTPNSADATLTQINRYWQIGLLRKKEQALQITSQFVDAIRDVQRMTYRGAKGTGATYKLYESTEPVGTSYVLAKTRTEQYCYIRVQSFNTIVTRSNVFCNDVGDFLNFHLDTSTLISGAKETARLTFFNNLLAKIESTGLSIRDDDRWNSLEGTTSFEL